MPFTQRLPLTFFAALQEEMRARTEAAGLDRLIVATATVPCFGCPGVEAMATGDAPPRPIGDRRDIDSVLVA